MATELIADEDIHPQPGVATTGGFRSLFPQQERCPGLRHPARRRYFKLGSQHLEEELSTLGQGRAFPHCLRGTRHEQQTPT
jgi:hypothetical protein